MRVRESESGRKVVFAIRKGGVRCKEVEGGGEGWLSLPLALSSFRGSLWVEALCGYATSSGN